MNEIFFTLFLSKIASMEIENMKKNAHRHIITLLASLQKGKKSEIPTECNT